MALTTRIKNALNNALRPLNLRMDTLTSEKAERVRLEGLEAKGHFNRPSSHIVELMEQVEFPGIAEELEKYEHRFSTFENPMDNDVEYTYDNDYFSSPDTEILYAIVRAYQPQTICEIGCGNSTRVARLAIRDGGLGTKVICIDPYPRTSIAAYADEVIKAKVEESDLSIVDRLRPNDILFIDSSHEIKAGNDVSFLCFEVLPLLAKGTLVHIHDIFLPYDYPRDWVVDLQRQWSEQYIVQAILTYSDQFEILWAGYYLQRNGRDFSSYFPHLNGHRAQSLWLQKVK